jgi:hypothetical protein
MEFAISAALALLVGFLSGLLGGSAIVRNAGPTATPEALAELSRLRLEWDAWRKGAEGVLEAMDDIADTVERKRRRIAASESKQRPANGTPDPMDRDELRRRARSLGLPV